MRLNSPDGWGALQETDSAAANHIRVAASSRMVDQEEISYGARYVLVPLLDVEARNIIEFVLSNVVAQPTTALAEFKIESSGGPSDGLKRVKGEARPKDADDAIITDEYMLLGRVYHDNDNNPDWHRYRCGH